MFWLYLGIVLGIVLVGAWFVDRKRKVNVDHNRVRNDHGRASATEQHVRHRNHLNGSGGIGGG